MPVDREVTALICGFKRTLAYRWFLTLWVIAAVRGTVLIQRWDLAGYSLLVVYNILLYIYFEFSVKFLWLVRERISVLFLVSYYCVYFRSDAAFFKFESGVQNLVLVWHPLVECSSPSWVMGPAFTPQKRNKYFFHIHSKYGHLCVFMRYCDVLTLVCIQIFHTVLKMSQECSV